MGNAPDYFNDTTAKFICNNLFQNLEFPKEHPALILVHMEHPAMEVRMHWHPGPELIYSRNKRLNLYIDGKKEVIEPGHFALISSYAVHTLEPDPDDIHQDVMSISFNAKYLEQIFPRMRKSHISVHSAAATDDIRVEMQRLLEELRQNVEFSKNHFRTNQLLFAILGHMYDEFLDGELDCNVSRLVERNKIVEILDYVDKNFCEQLTTQSVADHFGYTREYFCRLFRQYGDSTFKKYLTDVRLNAAERELNISNRPVGYIALKNGFPDEKSFFSAFKKKYNMTPVQYRHMASKDIPAPDL